MPGVTIYNKRDCLYYSRSNGRTDGGKHNGNIRQLGLPSAAAARLQDPVLPRRRSTAAVREQRSTGTSRRRRSGRRRRRAETDRRYAEVIRLLQTLADSRLLLSGCIFILSFHLFIALSFYIKMSFKSNSIKYFAPVSFDLFVPFCVYLRGLYKITIICCSFCAMNSRVTAALNACRNFGIDSPCVVENKKHQFTCV